MDYMENLIVMDYMPNGSLFSLLHHHRGDNLLPPQIEMNLDKRLTIAYKLAKALAYLHDHSIVHGSLKSANVLIADQGEPCLSDYGLVHLMETPLTTIVQGYVPPEVFIDVHNLDTIKADIYSFGVLMLELITGKSPLSDTYNDMNLVIWVQSIMREHGFSNVIDPTIITSNNFQLAQIAQLLEIALQCSNDLPNLRPSMSCLLNQIETLIQPHHDQDKSIGTSSPMNRNEVFQINGCLIQLQDIMFKPSYEVMHRERSTITYKATLQDDGKTFLVTQLNHEHDLTREEIFKQQVEKVASLHHPNLVPLLAHHFKCQETFFVFKDYLHYQSLFSLLHKNFVGNTKEMFHWEWRLNVIKDVSKGLTYLHDKSIVHGKLNSCNVFLCNEGVTYICNYGLTYCDQSHFVHDGASENTISFKDDISAFGVLIFELLSGNHIDNQCLNDKEMVNTSIDWAHSIICEQRTTNFFDSTIIKSNVIRREMVELFYIALSCLSPYPHLRPSIIDIDKKINDIRDPHEA